MSRNESDPPESPRRTGPMTPNWFLLAVIAAVLAILFVSSFSDKLLGIESITTSTLNREIERGNVKSVTIGDGEARGFFHERPLAIGTLDNRGQMHEYPKDAFAGNTFGFRANIGPDHAKLEELLQSKGVVYQLAPNADPIWPFFSLLLLATAVAGGLALFVVLRRAQSGNGGLFGGGFLSGFTRSLARRYEPTQNPVTFRDVAGLESVKADLTEIVEFLRDPRKFQRLGGRVPRGVLLSGPPGTGKTLLARAIAGEAGVPFFSVNGSEFIQMFVGVGATRVRDLFKTAKDSAPSIVFIDEIDAVGRQRGAGFGGGHDEREQTLNQILSEMDGFTPSELVIVVAATNRPDVLDPALLRPGRFDRSIVVDRPTQKGRVELFKVHSKNVPLGDDFDVEHMASTCIGMTGADIRNVVNEAALWAARQDKSKVDRADFEYARDKVVMGAKREESITPESLAKTAYHEAGHAVVGWLLPGCDPVHKVTIVPRGRALGVTMSRPSDEVMSYAKSQLEDRLAMRLAGRAAELIAYGEVAMGAQDDLERATDLARRMVSVWGMSDRVGPASFKTSESDPFLGREMGHPREFSEQTLQLIDEEVKRILNDAAGRAEKLLSDHRAHLDAVTRLLLEREEIDESDLEAILGPSVHLKRTVPSAVADVKAAAVAAIARPLVEARQDADRPTRDSQASK